MANPETVFKKFDVNNDGKMSSKELETALKEMGVTASPELLKVIMAQYDSDKNGFLEFSEFKKVIADMKAIQAATVDDTREIFKNYDKDGSGFIERAELKEVLAVLGIGNDETTVKAMMAAADTNKDDKVSVIEFAKIMAHGK
ncbi:uncharacterized protein [Branchiostoma lanceolatum]|uniref:uncharacterized protein n=1 Tax=Branchiostoma lanceolatum TaxID=7740 RepID=UPI0034537017